MLLEIWNALNNKQKISSNIFLEQQVYSIAYEGMTILVIEVPRADRHDKPIYVGRDMFHGTFRRNYEGDYHCDREEVKALLRDQADSSADALVLDKVDLSALNQESIKGYRNIFNGYKPGHIWSKLSTPEFLAKIGAA